MTGVNQKIIKDTTLLFFGIFGMFSIVFNLWKSIFVRTMSPINLFFYVILTIFSTLFFWNLIYNNIRWSRIRYKLKNKREK